MDVVILSYFNSLLKLDRPAGGGAVLVKSEGGAPIRGVAWRKMSRADDEGTTRGGDDERRDGEDERDDAARRQEERSPAAAEDEDDARGEEAGGVQRHETTV